jgi:hypothetical protein
MSRAFGGIDGIKLGTSQSIACTTTSTNATNAFGAQTWAVRVAVSGTGLTHYRVGDGTQTAVTSDPFLPTGWVDIIRVTPGQKIAAITESGTATLTVTEATQ